MQIDFHYYCIFVLANMAGFSRQEARTIAYCSQFVDDSQDSEQIQVGEYTYDTVRTAHMGIRAFDWNVQKKVFFPFHFIPERPLNGERFSYITVPDSEFARLLVDEAAAEPSELRLYRLGVALHTFADSWAHQNFSGRVHEENEVEKLCRNQEGHWVKCQRFWDFILDLFRAKVGHLQAYQYPDYADEEWRYRDWQKRELQRKNTSEFLQAAKTIYRKLAEITGKKRPLDLWRKNESRLQKLLEMPCTNHKNGLSKKCDHWIEEFPEYFRDAAGNVVFRYNPEQWREEAMRRARASDLPGFVQTDWARFQRAALKQRYLVLEHLM